MVYYTGALWVQEEKTVSRSSLLCLELVQGRKGKKPPLRGLGLPSYSLHLASETKMSQVMLLNSLWRTVSNPR